MPSRRVEGVDTLTEGPGGPPGAIPGKQEAGGPATSTQGGTAPPLADQGSKPNDNVPPPEQMEGVAIDPIGTWQHSTAILPASVFSNKTHIMGYDTLVKFPDHGVFVNSSGEKVTFKGYKPNVSPAIGANRDNDASYFASPSFNFYESPLEGQGAESNYAPRIDPVRHIFEAWWNYDILSQKNNQQDGTLAPFRDGVLSDFVTILDFEHPDLPITDTTLTTGVVPYAEMLIKRKEGLRRDLGHNYQNQQGFAPDGSSPSDAKYVQQVEDALLIYYIDMAFDLDLPKFDGISEYVHNKLPISSNYVKINSTYNFYVSSYEPLINDSNFVEYALPNIYAFINEMSREKLASVPGSLLPRSQRKLINLDYGLGKALTMYAGANPPVSLSNLTTYLKAYATEIKKSPSILDAPKNGKRSATTGISINSLDYLLRANEVKEKFPMYMEIDISTSNVGKVGGMMKEAGIFDTFMKAIMMALPAKLKFPGGSVRPGDAPASRQFLFFNEQENVSIMDLALNESIGLEGSSIKKRREHLAFFELNEIFGSPTCKFDLSSILSKLSPYDLDIDSSGISPATENESIVLFGDKPSATSTQSILEYIKGTIFKLQCSKLINDNYRHLWDIYQGKKCYSEVLFYEIVKYEMADGTLNNNASFVQNIFLPNDGERSILKYIDTQVKYGKKYHYQIYAHTFVIGTKYKLDSWDSWFTSEGVTTTQDVVKTDWVEDQSQPGWVHPDNRVDEDGNPITEEETTTKTYERWWESFITEYWPEVQLVRVPYYNTMTTNINGPLEIDFDEKEVTYRYDKLEKNIVHDDPPVFPDINIVPFKGKNDRILINFNFMGGEYDLAPIPLSQDDIDILEDVREAQKKKGPTLLYRTDEQVGFFEAYRIETKPTSYDDFKPLDISRRPKTPLDSKEETAFVDTLLPNKDYYYMFRVKDIHGNISNPTPIYHVRIIDSPNSAPYTIIKTYFIEDLKKQETEPIDSKYLMKYIRIQPSFAQTFIDQDDLLANYNSADSLDSSNIDFGSPAIKEDVFGKRFKFRFTSKKTGKKFDLNVTVKNPHFTEKTDKTS